MEDKEDRQLILGLNLGSRFSEVSWYDEAINEPVVYHGADESTEIETALYRTSDDHWICGQEAFDQSLMGSGQLMTGFLDNYEEETEIDTIAGVYEKRTLVGIFIKKVLELLKEQLGDFSVAGLTFSIDQVSKTLASDIVEIAEDYGIDKSLIRVQSHLASFEYYALSKPKELWLHDVGMFQYDEDGLNYYHMSVNHRKKPSVIQAQKVPLKMYMNYSMLKSLTKEELDNQFVDVLNEVLANKLISTIYLTGKGFEDATWLDASRRRLCSGRKVYAEEGVYALGACYSCYLEVNHLQFKQFIALNDDILPYSLYLKGYTSGTPTTRELTVGGASWYSVSTNTEFILDGTDTVTFKVRDFVTGQEKMIPFVLEDLPARPEKTLHIKLEVSFEDETICMITMSDQGFGSLYPSSGKIWKKRINVAEYECDKNYKETGRVLFPKDLKDPVPYCFKVSNTRVASAEQLCYYLANNVYILNTDTFGEELLYWIEKTLAEPGLAIALRELKVDEAPLQELVMRVLDHFDYYTQDERAQLGYILDEIEQQNPVEHKKLQADNLVRYGRYMEAITAYVAVAGKIENDKELAVSQSFKGSVYHNLGVAYTRLMNYRSAAACFHKAYALNQDDESLRSCLMAHKMDDNETGFFDVMESSHLTDTYIENLLKAYDQIEEQAPDTEDVTEEQVLEILSGIKAIYRD